MGISARIGFIGTGKMAVALAKGMVDKQTVASDQVIGTDPFGEAREAFQSAVGAWATTKPMEVLQRADVIFVAVKPDKVEEALVGINPHFTTSHLLVSIAAGVPLAIFEENLLTGARVIRVMPNTPAMVGVGASGFALGTHASEADGQLAEQLLSAVGVAVRVSESLLDAVTGLSGSGPAFVFQIIEALSDGGVAAGLPRDTATRLAAQTVLGGAKMVLETGMHPGPLKDMVTSPGGTTIDGVHELEKGGLRAALMNAVRAAAAKSRRLGRRGQKKKRF
ncbi:MAG: Pyrroline-5-carboxylate reductase [Verrucomicrobia subdivision 3 bacterium]|nr:Pyrroline-5-carboxylate reductase [Limisphaerales bacterium]MCS1412525.1 Pyrroline-5-carboxylate reductase [Limisphaerales bacterium]